MTRFLLLFFLALCFSANAQQIKVEYDKGADLSNYKTFSFGEGQIITPKDERTMADDVVHKWVRTAVTEELTEKGLSKLDSGADLVISYLIGTDNRSDAGSVGPLGMTPGSSSQTYLRDYKQGTLVIDLNDKGSNKLVWRVSAVTDATQQEGEKIVDQVVERGFQKFTLKAKKKRSHR